VRIAPSADGSPGAAHPANRHAVDMAAFEELYRLHRDRVYRYCLSQVGSASDAEDLAADVFVAALHVQPGQRSGSANGTGRGRDASSEPAGPDEALAWLLHVARNKVVDHHRRRARRSAVLARFFSRPSEWDPRADVEASILRRDELATILDAFGRLRPRDREVVGLRLAAGLSYDRIAAVLGISEHAATVATRRAVERLRKIVEAER
jgi:RNA polymerase sigma-70 factor, ECF subfamily